MNLSFLNKIKKEDKDKRRVQNKKYREKNKEILNLKKRRIYYKTKLGKKLTETEDRMTTQSSYSL